MSIQSKWLWAAGILAAGAALVAFEVPMQYVLLGGLLLLCPLMMFFMGRHNMDGGSKKGAARTPSDTPHGGTDRKSK